MDKKAYLYIVEAGQFSFEVEIKAIIRESRRYYLHQHRRN